MFLCEPLALVQVLPSRGGPAGVPRNLLCLEGGGTFTSPYALDEATSKPIRVGI